MKDFDIAKYLKEHRLGSYGILNHYVDLKPVKEEVTPEEIEEIPYEGPEDKLTGMGDKDSFEQAETVSEEEIEEEWYPHLTEPDHGEMILKAIEKLEAAGISIEEIKAYLEKLSIGDRATGAFE